MRFLRFQSTPRATRYMRWGLADMEQAREVPLTSEYNVTWTSQAMAIFDKITILPSCRKPHNSMDVYQTPLSR